MNLPELDRHCAMPLDYQRFTGQLRFETFNTFNHTNPIWCASTSLISSFYDQVTSTRDPRILQPGMKVNV